MLPQRLNIELCRPFRAYIANGTFYVGARPYAVLYRPFGAMTVHYIDKLISR